MPTIKPANFPRIYRGSDQTLATQPEPKVGKAAKSSDLEVKTPTANEIAGKQKPPQKMTLHASQAKVLKFYQPNQAKIKEQAQLGQIVDIKI